MESFNIQNLTFAYPGRQSSALGNIDITINNGEFVTLCGKSGCGKTTLLRLLKSATAPNGTLEGCIYFEGRPLCDVPQREQVSKIGFVMQSPENQIVTDKVWHELAFGAESLGLSTTEIRGRVSEMASFFGIQNWFHKSVTELSGGQKQLLNLASVMVMQPSVLILDEPTSQLDPIAASEFLKILEKINRELGVTVILSEHRLDEVFAIADRVIVLDEGRVIADAEPKAVAKILKSGGHGMYAGLPVPVRVWAGVENDMECPLTVRDGRVWLEKYAANHRIDSTLIPDDAVNCCNKNQIIELKDMWFRYNKNSEDIVKGMNLTVNQGEIFALMGGNGAGKTTALSLISGLNVPYRGKVLIKGDEIKKIDNLYGNILGVLPQDPVSLFVKKTVQLELEDALGEEKFSKEEKTERIKEISVLCGIDGLMEAHPYDLSGGEQQRAALAKVLIKTPEILLLDEPTKGMDAQFEQVFAEILKNLKSTGVTVVMVSHDIEFCAKYADRCALMFDGGLTSVDVPRRFFAGKSFYTTSANRMARNILPDAVLAEDIILACGGGVLGNVPAQKPKASLSEEKKTAESKKSTKISPLKIVLGSVFSLLFVFVCLIQFKILTVPYGDIISGMASGTMLQWVTIVSAGVALWCFVPGGRNGIGHQQKGKRSFTKRTLVAILFVMIAVPLTVFAGMFFLQDKQYYFISFMIILEIMIPFFISFEGRKPSARELVIISVLCAFAVAGRAAFSMLPQFKPMVAVVIIAGVCFGGEAGFLVGAVAAFVSNFFAGQGNWTPWQMVACGMVGFLGGILVRAGWLRKSRLSLSVFGFIATFVIYGGIVDSQFVLMFLSKLSTEAIVSSYIMGVPFNLIHGASTALFLWFISEPMIEKLERVKIKYGLLDR